MPWVDPLPQAVALVTHHPRASAPPALLIAEEGREWAVASRTAVRGESVPVDRTYAQAFRGAGDWREDWGWAHRSGLGGS